MQRLLLQVKPDLLPVCITILIMCFFKHVSCLSKIRYSDASTDLKPFVIIKQSWSCVFRVYEMPSMGLMTIFHTEGMTIGVQPYPFPDYNYEPVASRWKLVKDVLLWCSAMYVLQTWPAHKHFRGCKGTQICVDGSNGKASWTCGCGQAGMFLSCLLNKCSNLFSLQQRFTCQCIEIMDLALCPLLWLVVYLQAYCENSGQL